MSEITLVPHDEQGYLDIIANETNHGLPAVKDEYDEGHTIEMNGPRPSLPLQGFRDGYFLSWHDVDYVVKTKDKKNPEKQILFHMTGCAKPGEMVAIMGTSGSGKTSFLNVLSGRHVDGLVRGSILLNHERRRKDYHRMTAYVEQHDYLFASLTVKETFVYQALLRLPSSLSREEKFQRAEEVLVELGLSTCRNTMIGNEEIRGVSGGEKKRVSIGIELITDPKLLFIDEPTSGLDSFTAFQIMRTVKDLTTNGRSVLCTIHQPRSNIFHLFDKLILLTQGRVVYYGPVSESEEFFASCGHDVPRNTNSADHFLDITTVDTRDPDSERVSQARVNTLIAAYRSSKYHQLALDESDQGLRENTRRKSVRSGFGTKEEEEALQAEDEARGHASWNLIWIMEFLFVLRRTFLNASRDPMIFAANMGQAIFVSVIAGIVFLRINRDQQSIQDRNGALFFLALNQAFVAMGTALECFHREKAPFMRERAAGTYRISSFYLAKILAEAPFHIIPNLVFCVISYFMIGLDEKVDKFFIFVLIMISSSLTAQSLGIFFSAISEKLSTAQVLAPVTMVVLMLFGGFYANEDTIWIGLSFIKYLSFVRYVFITLVLNEYKGLTFSCVDATQCYATGDEVLKYLNFDEFNLWEEWLKLMAVAVGFRILGYLALRYKNRPKIVLNTKPKAIFEEEDSNEGAKDPKIDSRV